MILLTSLVLAAPDRIASTFAAGVEVSDIVASDDGLWVGWSDPTQGEFTILDAGFHPTTNTACAGATGAAVFGDSTTGWTFLTGCGDGTVTAIEVSPEGEISIGTTVWELGTGPVLAVESDGTTVYGVLEEDAGTVVSALTLADSGKVDGYPVTLTNDTIEDTLLISGSLIVVHAADEVSKITVSSGTLVTPQSKLGRTLVDAFPYPAASAVYLADSGGGLVRFDSTNDYLGILTNVADTVTSIGIHPEAGWAVLGAGDDTLVYAFDAGTFSTPPDTISGAANIEEFAVIDGYAFGATSDGTVLALTDYPWVTVGSVSPSTALDGDVVTVDFTTDTAGSYEIWVGGTFEEPDTQVDSGEVSAYESVSAEFTVADLPEGINRVWVYVDAGASRIGRGSGELTVNNPPGTVKLTEAGVSFGNSAVYVEFTALDDADIVAHTIYFTDEPFDAADYPIGGPGFTGEDDISVPILATAEPGATVTRTISPLTNGTTYYVAVRAIDNSGLEGPMSAIRSATPEETLCAACLAGDEGGYWPEACNSGGSAGAGVLGMILASAGLLRRRARPLAVAVVALGAAVVSPVAHAEDDESPVSMNLQLRYGPTTVADAYVQTVFGTKPNEMLWFEYGYASRFVDATVGLGFYQELGWLQTSAGAASADHDMFTMFPITLTVSGKLDILKEQPIVPVARVGLDYWLWKENWQVPDPDTMDYVRDGGKYGWHYGGAVMILLDTLDRRAASRLDASTGINDTYLVAEYRQTNLVTGTKKLNLSSSEFTFGLKFDF
jgi:hypothetical protein